MQADQLISQLPRVTAQEAAQLRQIMDPMGPSEAQQFAGIYKSSRKDPQNILLFNLLALLGVGGVHRFVGGEVGMGILYLLTGGLCLIGTLVDAIQNKKISNRYNMATMQESLAIVRPAAGDLLSSPRPSATPLRNTNWDEDDIVR